MLKLITIALGFTVLLTTSAVSAEENVVSTETPPEWTLQVDPLTTYLGYVHLQLERKLSSSFSFYGGPHLRLFSPPGLPDPETFYGLGVELGLRWYFLGDALCGPWALVRGVGARTWDDVTTGYGGYVSVLAGYTYIIDAFWVLSGGAGVQYLDYGVRDKGPSGILPALHTAVGIAF